MPGGLGIDLGALACWKLV